MLEDEGLVDPVEEEVLPEEVGFADSVDNEDLVALIEDDLPLKDAEEEREDLEETADIVAELEADFDADFVKETLPVLGVGREDEEDLLRVPLALFDLLVNGSEVDLLKAEDDAEPEEDAVRLLEEATVRMVVDVITVVGIDLLDDELPVRMIVEVIKEEDLLADEDLPVEEEPGNEDDLEAEVEVDF